MNTATLEKLFADTAYIRTGGSEEERRAADYIVGCCLEYGLQASLDPFDVPMAEVHTATLTVTDGDGTVREIPCKGYFGAGSGTLEAG